MNKALLKLINEILSKINNKRAEIVIKHILKNGYITTEQLRKDYGYEHPPRAACDVREAGIPLETFKVKSEEGKSIAAYRFGDLKKIRKGRISGRLLISKEIKEHLFNKTSGRCEICGIALEIRYFQVDHRIPYEIGGETTALENSDLFMLLCNSCNRAKSWSCEHCENWKTKKDVVECSKCYWANPNVYTHISLMPLRRLELLWQGKEIEEYDILKDYAEKIRLELPAYIKRLLKMTLNGKKSK